MGRARVVPHAQRAAAVAPLFLLAPRAAAPALDELAHPDSVASLDEWGHADVFAGPASPNQEF